MWKWLAVFMAWFLPGTPSRGGNSIIFDGHPGSLPPSLRNARLPVGHPGDVETGRHPGGAAFVAADVHYLVSGGARAAAVLAGDAAFSRLVGHRIAVVPQVAPYQPGQFWLREFPPLHAVLDSLTNLALLMIDGHADLDPDGRPGLGARAREEFGVPVIGVAKSPFRTATHAVPVLRGTSAAVRHSRRNAPHRRRRPRPAHGRPTPAT